MKSRIFSSILFCLVSWFSAQSQVFPNLGGQRAGISALTFIKNDLSPRSIAMGGASVALGADAFSMGINPAGAANQEFPVVGLSSRKIIPGLYQSYLSGIIPTRKSETLLFSLNYLGGTAQKRRTEFQPLGDGTVYSSDAFKVGLGYSKALSKMFSFGLNMNYIREQLAQYSAGAVTVDLGFLYRTDWKDLSFAVGLQHFGGNSTLNGSELAQMYNRTKDDVTKDAYGAPTLFSMGVSAIPLDEDKHQILTSIQLNHPNDNAENIRLGVQYGFDSLVYFRVGYRINVPGEEISAGVGLRSRIGSMPFRIDYAVLPNRYLGLQHSIGLSLGFQKIGQ